MKAAVAVDQIDQAAVVPAHVVRQHLALAFRTWRDHAIATTSGRWRNDIDAPGNLQQEISQLCVPIDGRGVIEFYAS